MAIKIDDETGLPFVERGAQSKRGKVLPPPVRCANSDERGGMGQRLDQNMIEAGRKVLSEALGSGE